MPSKKTTKASSDLDNLSRHLSKLVLAGKQQGSSLAGPKSKSQKKKEAVNNVVSFFAIHYGQDDTKLAAWQKLCVDMGVTEGNTVSQCKKNLKGIYVNILDYVNAQNSGRACRRFHSYKGLQNYTFETGRFFPLNKAKTNPILKWMLVTML